MNDHPRRQLAALLAVHGPSLCDHPGLCEEVLREQCPGCEGEVSLLVRALEEGVVTRLREGADSASELAGILSETAGVSGVEARWAVDSWSLALGKPAPAPSLPQISLGENETPRDGVAPFGRRELAILGTRAGLLTGSLVGSFLGFIGLMYAVEQGEPGLGWLHLCGWLLGGPLLAGAVGWVIGPGVGATQQELAGGIAGAVVGTAGGIVYSPLLGELMAPLQDPSLEALLRAVLGALLGLVIGTVLGIFHQVFWTRWRRRRYDPLLDRCYTVSAVEQQLQDEVDRRAGL